MAEFCPIMAWTFSLQEDPVLINVAGYLQESIQFTDNLTGRNDHVMIIARTLQGTERHAVRASMQSTLSKEWFKHSIHVEMWDDTTAWSILQIAMRHNFQAHTATTWLNTTEGKTNNSGKMWVQPEYKVGNSKRPPWIWLSKLLTFVCESGGSGTIQSIHETLASPIWNRTSHAMVRISVDSDACRNLLFHCATGQAAITSWNPDGYHWYTHFSPWLMQRRWFPVWVYKYRFKEFMIAMI